MHFEKEEMKSDKWVLVRGNFRFPVFDTIRAMLTFVLMAIAFISGQYIQNKTIENTMIMAELCELKQSEGGYGYSWDCREAEPLNPFPLKNQTNLNFSSDYRSDRTG